MDNWWFWMVLVGVWNMCDPLMKGDEPIRIPKPPGPKPHQVTIIVEFFNLINHLPNTGFLSKIWCGEQMNHLWITYL